MSEGRDVTVVVNGEELHYRIHPVEEDLPIRILASVALLDSQNTGRAPGDWELRHDNGNLVSQLWPIAQLRDHVFLTLRLGVGG
jgi:hypothetical protein